MKKSEHGESEEAVGVLTKHGDCSIACGPETSPPVLPTSLEDFQQLAVLAPPPKLTHSFQSLI